MHNFLLTECYALIKGSVRTSIPFIPYVNIFCSAKLFIWTLLQWKIGKLQLLVVLFFFLIFKLLLFFKDPKIFRISKIISNNQQVNFNHCWSPFIPCEFVGSCQFSSSGNICHTGSINLLVWGLLCSIPAPSFTILCIF